MHSTNVFAAVLLALGWDPPWVWVILLPPILCGLACRPGWLAAVGGAISIKLAAAVCVFLLSPQLWWDHGIEVRAGPVSDYVFGAVLALTTSFLLRRRIRAVRGRLAGRLSAGRVA